MFPDRSPHPTAFEARTSRESNVVCTHVRRCLVLRLGFSEGDRRAMPWRVKQAKYLQQPVMFSVSGTATDLTLAIRNSFSFLRLVRTPQPYTYITIHFHTSISSQRPP